MDTYISHVLTHIPRTIAPMHERPDGGGDANRVSLEHPGRRHKMLHIAQGNMQEGERGGGREMHSGEKSINGFLLGRRPFQEAQRRERVARGALPPGRQEIASSSLVPPLGG